MLTIGVVGSTTPGRLRFGSWILINGVVGKARLGTPTDGSCSEGSSRLIVGRGLIDGATGNAKLGTPIDGSGSERSMLINGVVGNKFGNCRPSPSWFVLGFGRMLFDAAVGTGKLAISESKAPRRSGAFWTMALGMILFDAAVGTGKLAISESKPPRRSGALWTTALGRILFGAAVGTGKSKISESKPPRRSCSLWTIALGSSEGDATDRGEELETAGGTRDDDEGRGTGSSVEGSPNPRADKTPPNRSAAALLAGGFAAEDAEVCGAKVGVNNREGTAEPGTSPRALSTPGMIP
jgi:hypothetical protein